MDGAAREGGAVDSPTASAAEPWKALGRDTPAGKALFKLYNGTQGAKNAGQRYHARNKALHEKKVASGWAPAPVEPARIEVERPQIIYPSFGNKPNVTSETAARLQAIPRRRPAQQIVAEMEQDKARIREQGVPVPRGPLLDDREKERLAERMCYRGDAPKPTQAELDMAARHRGARNRQPLSRRAELEQLFDAVSNEVEERREFLAALEAAGELKKDHVHQLRVEIKTRVDELNRINVMIQELDA